MFTKKHKEQNDEMKNRAAQLVKQSGYRPETHGYPTQVKEIQRQLQAEFPDVAAARIRSRAIAALRQAYSDWRRRS